MRRSIPLLFLLLSLSPGGTDAAEPVTQGDVTLTVKVDGEQPTGWPVVVELTFTNVGKEPLGWWCGGPDVYPPAQHFAVQVRYGAEDDWHDVTPSNGQYVLGSGINRQLKPGESIVVPMAVPVEKNDGISLRFLTRDWHAREPALGAVQVNDDPEWVDHRRARVIAAALAQSPPFWQHLAEKYPDAVVIDAMLKSVTVDNAPMVAGAARVLARQETLPLSAGDEFAVLVRRWLPRSPRLEWGGLRENVVAAALKTRSEAARKAVLVALKTAPDAASRWIAIDALRQSPGDHGWLRRAQSAIIAVQRASPTDVVLAREAKLAVEWLDSRMKNGPEDEAHVIMIAKWVLAQEVEDQPNA